MFIVARDDCEKFFFRFYVCDFFSLSFLFFVESLSFEWNKNPSAMNVMGGLPYYNYFISY